MSFSFEEVSLSCIDSASNAYRISRPGGSARLCESVARHGVLEPPALVRTAEMFIPFTGHNRLEAAVASGISAVVCRVMDATDTDFFLKNAVLKHFRGELGVAGRIRACMIAAGLEGQGAPSASVLSSLELPSSLASSIRDILSLDESLLQYCDQKSVPLKTMLLLSSFSLPVCMAMSAWVTGSAVRMNMFKSAVDLLDDLLRVKTKDELCSLISQHKSASDDALVSALYALRNPVISQMNERAGVLCSEFKRHQVELVYPPFFEGNAVEVKLRMMRSDRGASCRKGLDYLREADFPEILELL